MTSHLVALFFNQFGTIAVIVPDQPGLEFDTNESRLHYHTEASRVHFDTDESRMHWDN